MTEHDHQVALFQWAALYQQQIPELALLYANQLGGKRPKATAIRMKREGAKAGVPDVTLPVARGGYHGLYIEMKVGKNQLTEKQEWWFEQLRKQGYKCVACWGWEAARDEISNYLGIAQEDQSWLDSM